MSNFFGYLFIWFCMMSQLSEAQSTGKYLTEKPDNWAHPNYGQLITNSIKLNELKNLLADSGRTENKTLHQQLDMFYTMRG